MRRLLAIGFIWCCCAGAWAILGSTLTIRSGSTSDDLRAEVRSLWGPQLVQAPPSAIGTETHRELKTEQRYEEKARRYVEVSRHEDVTTTAALALDASELAASIDLEHRRKGLLWFPTYAVSFTGHYTFRNPTAEARRVTVSFPLEAGVTYDGFAVTGASGQPIDVAFEKGRATFERAFHSGEAHTFTVAYRTRGTERWGYGVAGQGLGPEAGRARHFALQVDTNFAAVDFPAGTISPTAHRAQGGRWSGTWHFEQIVGTTPIAVELPQRLNPGPLAAKITFFAPISLLFFFFVTGMLLAARRRSIHPVNYFLLACAFFAFHLLFAYLIDHLEVEVSFAVAALVSVALVVSYARLFVGWRLALLQLGISQLVYLVIFSFTFFWQGFTGLAITAGAIATLFVVMQLTGRLDWDEVLGRTRSPIANAAPTAQV
jgi:hypothetical protein